MTKSQRANKKNDKIYEWIEHLQKDPSDEAVQEKIVTTYENLIHSLARKYSRNNPIHEDFVQVGFIGLLAAVKRFDPTYGRNFESFAIPTILGEIKRYIRDQSWSVHVPRRIKEMGPKIDKAVDELTSLHQRSPTIKDIATHLEVSEEEVLETMEKGSSYQALSVDRDINVGSDGSAVTLLDIVGDQDNEYDLAEFKLVLEQILPDLSEREQQILHYIFFENKSQKQVGELLGISQMHVSRLQRASLVKLREAIPVDKAEIIG